MTPARKEHQMDPKKNAAPLTQLAEMLEGFASAVRKTSVAADTIAPGTPEEETFEVLILDDKTGELRMDSRRGLRFVHEVLGTPIEFGLNFGGEPQTLKEIERSCDVCSGHRTLKLTHLATGMSAGLVEVPPGKSAIACARKHIDDLDNAWADDGRTPCRDLLIEVHATMPGASALERGTAQALKQKADTAKRRAENDAKFAAYQRQENVLEAIREERRRQDARWGEQNHPSICLVSAAEGRILPITSSFDVAKVCMDLEIPFDLRAKRACDARAAAGTVTWAHIAVEELSEAVCSVTDAERRKELVQLAAVVAAWIECIDRRAAGGAS
jgi:hypothetical protein